MTDLSSLDLMFIIASKRSGGRTRATKYPPPTRLLKIRSTPKMEEAEKVARANPTTTSITVQGMRVLRETIDTTTVRTRKPAMMLSTSGVPYFVLARC
jgi:hypothetical protein